MANVGFATLSVIPSFQGFQSRLSTGVAGPMATAGKNGGRKFGDAAGKEAGTRFRSSWSDRMKGFAPLAGLAVGASAVGFFKGAIDEASALSESGNKINVIFGDAAETVNAFADAASEGLGQSDLQARNAAASFGVYGKAAGLAGQELAGFSTDLTALASDLASFYDTSVEDAILAIGSGLRGEAEPLRQYGVLLDDATLRQEALRQGLVATTKDALSPQNKVLAAQAVIMQQTAVAQGDFAGTSDGLANSSRDLKADFADLTAELGEKLLPAVTGTVGFLKDDALPAVETLGGVVSDAATAFGRLPSPVRDATFAMAAFALASKFGVGPQNAVDGLRGSMQRLRDEAALQQALANGISGGYRRLGDEAAGATVGLTKLQTASALASRSMSRLRGAAGSLLGAVGGPWAIGLGVAAAAVTHFWREQQEAKARVESMTEALNQQTGALTKNNREIAAKALRESGAVDLAKKWGVSLEDLTSAALGQADAQARVNSQMDDYFLKSKPIEGVNQQNAQAYNRLSEEAGRLRDAIGDQSAEVVAARREWRDNAAQMGDSESATDSLRGATVDYSSALRDARDNIRGLIDAEEERRKNALQDRRDRLGLLTALRDTREELNEGKKSLNENTKAGQENLTALYDLAEQWNRSGEAVKNQKGAYRDFRKQFIDLATAMGGGGDSAAARAKELAEEILQLPDNKQLKITTPGMDEALSKLRLMRDLAAPGGLALETKLKGDSFPARANGGGVEGGYPYWVGERGPELVVPRGSGTVLTAEQSAAVSGGSREYHFHGIQNLNDARRELQHSAQLEAIGGFDFR